MGSDAYHKSSFHKLEVSKPFLSRFFVVVLYLVLINIINKKCYTCELVSGIVLATYRLRSFKLYNHYRQNGVPIYLVVYLPLQATIS